MRKFKYIFSVFSVLLGGCFQYDPNYVDVEYLQCKNVSSHFSKIKVDSLDSDVLGFIMDDGYEVLTKGDLPIAGTLTYQVCNYGPFGPTNKIISIEPDTQGNK